MDSLFGTYEFLYPMIWASDARDFTVTGASLEDENVSNGSNGRAVHGRHRVLPAFSGCTIPGAQAAGIGDRVRPQFGSGENPNAGPQQHQQPQQPMSRAA